MITVDSSSGGHDCLCKLSSQTWGVAIVESGPSDVSIQKASGAKRSVDAMRIKAFDVWSHARTEKTVMFDGQQHQQPLAAYFPHRHLIIDSSCLHWDQRTWPCTSDLNLAITAMVQWLRVWQHKWIKNHDGLLIVNEWPFNRMLEEEWLDYFTLLWCFSFQSSTEFVPFFI